MALKWPFMCQKLLAPTSKMAVWFIAQFSYVTASHV